MNPLESWGKRRSELRKTSSRSRQEEGGRGMQGSDLLKIAMRSKLDVGEHAIQFACVQIIPFVQRVIPGWRSCVVTTLGRDGSDLTATTIGKARWQELDHVV